MSETQVEVASPSEISKNSNFSDTIPLPLENGEFIHIEASQQQLSDSFAEYANKLGHDSEKAKRFFDEKVDFTFGKLKNMAEPPEMAKVDQILSKAILAVARGDYLGVVAHSTKGGYEFALNTPLIVKQLPEFRINGVFSVNDYNKQTREERVATVEQTIESITHHEFYHLLQAMEQPELIDALYKQHLINQRIFVAWITASLTTSQVLANTKIGDLGSILGGLAVAGAGLYIQGKNSKVNLEDDAYDAQKKFKEIQLLHKPFTFIHEADPKKV